MTIESIVRERKQRFTYIQGEEINSPDFEWLASFRVFTRRIFVLSNFQNKCLSMSNPLKQIEQVVERVRLHSGEQSFVSAPAVFIISSNRVADGIRAPGDHATESKRPCTDMYGARGRIRA